MFYIQVVSPRNRQQSIYLFFIIAEYIFYFAHFRKLTPANCCCNNQTKIELHLKIVSHNICIEPCERDCLFHWMSTYSWHVKWTILHFPSLLVLTVGVVLASASLPLTLSQTGVIPKLSLILIISSIMSFFYLTMSAKCSLATFIMSC